MPCRPLPGFYLPPAPSSCGAWPSGSCRSSAAFPVPEERRPRHSCVWAGGEEQLQGAGTRRCARRFRRKRPQRTDLRLNTARRGHVGRGAADTAVQENTKPARHGLRRRRSAVPSCQGQKSLMAFSLSEPKKQNRGCHPAVGPRPLACSSPGAAAEPFAEPGGQARAPGPGGGSSAAAEGPRSRGQQRSTARSSGPARPGPAGPCSVKRLRGSAEPVHGRWVAFSGMPSPETPWGGTRRGGLLLEEFGKSVIGG